MALLRRADAARTSAQPPGRLLLALPLGLEILIDALPVLLRALPSQIIHTHCETYIWPYGGETYIRTDSLRRISNEPSFTRAGSARCTFATCSIQLLKITLNRATSTTCEVRISPRLFHDMCGVLP